MFVLNKVNKHSKKLKCIAHKVKLVQNIGWLCGVYTCFYLVCVCVCVCCMHVLCT